MTQKSSFLFKIIFTEANLKSISWCRIEIVLRKGTEAYRIQFMK